MAVVALKKVQIMRHHPSVVNEGAISPNESSPVPRPCILCSVVGFEGRGRLQKLWVAVSALLRFLVEASGVRILGQPTRPMDHMLLLQVEDFRLLFDVHELRGNCHVHAFRDARDEVGKD
jgi:hypothetical protein